MAGKPRIGIGDYKAYINSEDVVILIKGYLNPSDMYTLSPFGLSSRWLTS